MHEYEGLWLDSIDTSRWTKIQETRRGKGKVGLEETMAERAEAGGFESFNTQFHGSK